MFQNPDIPPKGHDAQGIFALCLCSALMLWDLEKDDQLKAWNSFNHKTQRLTHVCTHAHTCMHGHKQHYDLVL